MGAILCGIATFRPSLRRGVLVTDYARYGPSQRLVSTDTAASGHTTHRSGEDGPTHQPVEHLAALRAIPNLSVIRPADANETAQAWLAALQAPAAPKALVLTRQGVPVLEGSAVKAAEGVARGAYVLVESSTEVPQVILLATGSEVQLAVEAAATLEADGVGTRVVSVPCMEWFEAQDDAYRESVLPAAVTARVSVEAGIAMPWKGYTGTAGRNVSLEHFGASADYKTLYREFGITAEAVVAAARDIL